MRDANNTKVGYTALCAIPLPPRSRSKGPPSSSSFSGPGGWGGPGGPGIARAHGGRRMRRRRRRRRRRGGRREEEEEGIIYPFVLVGGGPRPSAPSVNSVLYQMNLGMAGGRSNILLFFCVCNKRQNVRAPARAPDPRRCPYQQRRVRVLDAHFQWARPHWHQPALRHGAARGQRPRLPVPPQRRRSLGHGQLQRTWRPWRRDVGRSQWGTPAQVRRRPGNSQVAREPIPEIQRAQVRKPWALPTRWSAPVGAGGGIAGRHLSSLYGGWKGAEEEEVPRRGGVSCGKSKCKSTCKSTDKSTGIVIITTTTSTTAEKTPRPLCLLPSSCAAGACSGGKKKEEE